MGWRGLMRGVAAVAAALAAPSWAQRQEGKPPTVSTVVTQTSTDKQGYETYHVGVIFGPIATDVYALYGQKGSPLIMPPAYQVAAPFGTSVGPINEAMVSVHPDCAFDSWLTIGVDGPALIPNALSSVGLPLDDWSETQGINADNGAVFFMDPAHGATAEPVVFAQLTVPAGTPFRGQISAQGRSSGGNPDWDVTALEFSYSPADGERGAAAAVPEVEAGAEGAKDMPEAAVHAPAPLGATDGQPVLHAHGTRTPGMSLASHLEHDHDSSEADCTVNGLSAVSSSCPPAAAGSAVPSSCPRDCAETVNAWFVACMASRSGRASVQRLDHMLSGDLMRLRDLCAEGH